MKLTDEMIVSKALDLSTKCANELNLEIISCEYVFENGVKILRIIAEGSDGLTIDEASNLNEAISLKLDELDFIDEEYYLEVSSEGIEKELKNDLDITKSIGKYVFITFNEPVNKLTEVYGDLLNFNDEIITLQYNVKGRKKIIDIKKNQIKKIRLAVKF